MDIQECNYVIELSCVVHCYLRMPYCYASNKNNFKQYVVKNYMRRCVTV